MITNFDLPKNEKIILETLHIANSALKLKNLKLNSLLEITNAINNNFSTQQLLKIFEFVLRNQLNISKLALFTSDDTWVCSLKYGINENLNIPEIHKSLVKYKDITEFSDPEDFLFGHFEVIIPVNHKSIPLAYLLIGDFKEDLIENTNSRHIPFIQTLTNIIIVAIENKKLAKENIRQATVKREMELASQMQAMLFPSYLPNDDKLEVSALYLPNQEIGGDYYDFIRINDNEVAFCMADVSGKGVSAALLMSNFQANLRALFAYTPSLTDLIVQLNTKMIDSTKGEKFITLFLARYNLETRVMNYINAGQNPPLLLYEKTASQLTTGCAGIGMLEELPNVREGIVNISPGSIMLCYTDGVVELENEKGKEFGLSKLELIVLQKQNSTMSNLNQSVKNQLERHKGMKSYEDDITLLSCRFH